MIPRNKSESNVRQLAEARVRIEVRQRKRKKDSEEPSMATWQYDERSIRRPIRKFKTGYDRRANALQETKADLKVVRWRRYIIDREEYNTKMATLEAQHRATMSNLVKL